MKKIVLGLVLLVLDAECMWDGQFTVMNTSNETVKVVANLENGEFRSFVDLKRINHKHRPWLLESDFGFSGRWDDNYPLYQFKIHPGNFKTGTLVNPKEEEINRRIKTENLEGEAKTKLRAENAIRGQLDFYKDEILIGSFFIGTERDPYLRSFDVDKPEARFAVSEEANVFLRYIWWNLGRSGIVLKVQQYDPNYRYPNDVKERPMGLFADSIIEYEDDPNDPRPVPTESVLGFVHDIMTMTPEDPAPEDGCCSVW